MKKDVKTVLKKTVKIAGVTCLALSGVALITSGAALTALTAGARHIADSVKRIMDETPDAETAEATE